MPRRHRLAALLLACLFASWLKQAIVDAQPLVIGYERFHSVSPSIEGGRLLFNELGCVNCHRHPTGLPERKGPLLEGITNRLATDWILEFLLDPSSSKQGATMPQMRLSETEAEAVVHYLATLSPEKKTPKAFKFVNATRGFELYHNIGCAACHGPDPEFTPREGRYDPDTFTYPHIPFPNLSEKYDIHSLSAYLNKPHDYSPQGRMPRFALDREDPGDLAAYLLDYSNGDSTDYPKLRPLKVDPSLAKAGKAIVTSKNCAACHVVPKPNFFSWKRTSKINPSKTISKDHPEYNLSDAQQKSIELFLSHKRKEAPVLTHLESLNCAACHERNRNGGPDTARKAYFTGNPDLGDTGRFPPPLTDAGRKFQPDWLDDAIRGKKSVRPYLNVQMPDFGSTALNRLSSLLREEDANKTTRTVRNTHVEEGRKLLGAQGGLNCITCHGWGDRQSLGMSAINLSNMHQRLQLGWVQDYLVDPDSYRPNTLMPSFWPGGIASNQEILGGDTKMQIEAIYSFSKYGDGLPEGFPDINSSEYEIIPTDRPIVQRSFLEGVGTNALLVGFPEKLHFAIDGKTGQPAMMWKGRFFDAYRTWFSRFPEFEKPLGESVVRWDNEDSSGNSRYRGYRFGSDGIPEFLVELNGSVLYERLQPLTSDLGRPVMQRTLRYTSEAQLPDTRLQHPENVNTTEIETNNSMTRTFIYQW